MKETPSGNKVPCEPPKEIWRCGSVVDWASLESSGRVVGWEGCKGGRIDGKAGMFVGALAGFVVGVPFGFLPGAALSVGLGAVTSVGWAALRAFAHKTAWAKLGIAGFEWGEEVVARGGRSADLVYGINWEGPGKGKSLEVLALAAKEGIGEIRRPSAFGLLCVEMVAAASLATASGRASDKARKSSSEALSERSLEWAHKVTPSHMARLESKEMCSNLVDPGTPRSRKSL